jgi:hypothetical protein
MCCPSPGSTIPVGRSATADHRPIIVAWATPRSVSTAFGKTLSQAPGTTFMHEPFTDAYYFGPQRSSQRYRQPSRAPVDNSASVTSRIFRAARATERLVVKELAFQGLPYLSQDLLEAAVHTVVTRHPVAVYESLVQLKPDFTVEEFGFAPLGRLVERLVAHCCGPVIVVDGDAFRAQPERVLQDYCDAVALPFTPAMLSWSDGRIRDWTADEQESQARWHMTLEASHGVIRQEAPTPYAVPEGLSGTRHRQLLQAIEVYETLTGRSGAMALDPSS